jgi:hypothetical protein
MGIALLALSGFFKKISFTPVKASTLAKPRTSRPHPSWAVRPSGVCVATQRTAAPDHPPHLRVLRIQEKGQLAGSAGRMVISGRMADVCAELDRLVALESKHPNL